MRFFSGWTLFFAVVAIPTLEIYLSIKVGEYIGFWYSVLWIIMAMLFGVYLVREEKTEIIWRIAGAVREKRNFKYVLLDSGLSLLAGVLFFIPGVLSDIIALILLIIPAEWLPFKFKDDENNINPKEQTINQSEYSSHFESDLNSSKNQDTKKITLIEGEYKKED